MRLVSVHQGVGVVDTTVKKEGEKVNVGAGWFLYIQY